MLAGWLVMVAVQYHVPRISTSTTSLWAARGLAVGAAFFTLVAVLNFGASTIKSEFCSAFDPDANFLGLPCGFGAGFNIGVAAIVFSVATAVASFLHMGLELPQAYEFSSASADSGLKASFGSGASASASSYEPVGESGGYSSGGAVAGSAYQS